MWSNTWTPAAVRSEARPLRAALWRMVESQHVASTMKLVDSAAEQDQLEILIDQSKPPLPAAALGLHYLLASPFRYPPRPNGTRFRTGTDPGVFYGAETVRTACAELGYWRWRFLCEAVDLEQLGPVPHTAFRARIDTTAVDLRGPPFDRDAAAWTAPRDYRSTQAFGRIARAAGVGTIVYRSVRDPEPAWCAAVLTPQAFSQRKPDPRMQSWWLSVTRQQAVWRRQEQTHAFDAAPWQAAEEHPPPAA